MSKYDIVKTYLTKQVVGTRYTHPEDLEYEQFLDALSDLLEEYKQLKEEQK